MDSTKPAVPVRVSSIEIENYKSLDKLRLEFPLPSTAEQLDVFVLGSRNGGGKSSVLECLALPFSPSVPDFYRGCIRHEEDFARIQASLSVGGERCLAEILLSPTGANEGEYEENLPELKSFCTNVSTEGALLEVVRGKKEKVLVRPPLLFFPSHRRVVHGDTLLADAHTDLGGTDGDLFQAKLVLSLLRRDFGDGFPGAFEALSSGQKEIISTLFTIWSATYHQPSVVLIDEPELHLNAEWQRIFVSKLVELAPKNQYILATHSEEIFASVAKDRRLLLRKEVAA